MRSLARVVPPLVCLMLAACSLTVSNTAGPLVTPIPTVTAPQRQPITVQYCDEDSGQYPRTDFTAANQKVATSLVQAVIPNSQGLTLYASLIDSSTVDPSNTIAPFSVPPVSNYPTLPTPLPTPAESNPISYSATATAAANAQDQAIRQYNAQMTAVTQEVQADKTQVGNDAQRLTGWNPAVDNGEVSVLGCIQLGRQRLTGQPGTKYLIFASTMNETSGRDNTYNFTNALQGVNVIVIYMFCVETNPCQNAKVSWNTLFAKTGAKSVQYYDPAASDALTNLFGGA